MTDQYDNPDLRGLQSRADDLAREPDSTAPDLGWICADELHDGDTGHELMFVTVGDNGAVKRERLPADLVGRPEFRPSRYGDDAGDAWALCWTWRRHQRGEAVARG